MSSSPETSFQVIHNLGGFKIGSLNITSLYKHIDELTVLMAKETFDILAVNEIRLDNTNYNLIRRNRNRSGGGVCAYIRNRINYRRRWDLENEFLELLALEINKQNYKPLLVFCWYRPPHSSIEHFDVFEFLLKQAELGYSGIYLTGDINCNILQDSS